MGMSDRYMKLPISLLVDTEVSATARLVWAYIRYRQGRNSDAWPSLETISRELGLSLWATRQAIKLLVDKEYLKRNQDKTGRGNTAHYTALVKGVEIKSISKHKGCKNRTLLQDKGSENQRGKGLKTKTAYKEELVKENYSQNSTDEFRLAKLLFDLIRGWKPNYREPDLLGWAVHVDRLIRIDERTPAQIERVIRWCQQDSFWRSNILSTAKLRKQIDTLEAKMGTWEPPQASASLERGEDGLTPGQRLQASLEVHHAS
ncbi:helix-turn-helix domain-containing protein [Planctomycetota bacterium]